MAKSETPINRVLVFGASGYVGTHLVPSLAARGSTVRAVARRRTVLEPCGWPSVELVQADAPAPDTLGGIMKPERGMGIPPRQPPVTTPP